MVTAELLDPGPVAEPPQDMTACSRQVSARLPAGVHRLRRSGISSRVTKRSSSLGTSSVARQVITWSPRAEDDLR